MKKEKKGQSSVEMTVILVLVLLVFVFIFTSSNFAVVSFQRGNDEKMARVALEQIAGAGKRVYAEGSGSLDHLVINLPANINATFVGNKSLEMHLIIAGGAVQKVSRAVSFDVVGNISPDSGVQRLIVQSNGSFVYIRN